MPELPEVETIARGLRQVLPGRRIERVEVLHADVLAEGAEAFAGAVEGRGIEGVGRRGKNLLLRLEPPAVLWINLGMTGRVVPLLPGSEPASPPTHPAVRFRLARLPDEPGGAPSGAFVYDDVRRFGALEVLGPAASDERARRLGPEPLDPDFRPEDLHEALARSRSPTRSWLLDQRRVAGVGNIYANEALHRAGIHPARPARSVSADEAGRLHRALRAVLREAIEARGTTLRDYRDAAGEEGRFAALLRVYGRTSEPCRRCGTPVERIVFGNRSAFLCPACQPEGARG